jgi:hypothetical protein
MAVDPVAFGRLVIEANGERAGALGYERVNERTGSRRSAASPSTRASAAGGSRTKPRGSCSAT